MGLSAKPLAPDDTTDAIRTDTEVDQDDEALEVGLILGFYTNRK
jgi:hypothetical protein